MSSLSTLMTCILSTQPVVLLLATCFVLSMVLLVWVCHLYF